MTDHSYSYGKTNANYWQEKYPGIFDKVQGGTKHANLSQPTPRKAKPAPLPLRAPERAGDVIVLWLPLPPPELQSNRKSSLHYHARARLVKATREAAAFIARMVAPEPRWNAVRLDVTIWTARRIDRVNALEWLKATIDGAADGLGIDDTHFQPGDIVQRTGKASEGRREVELTLTRLEPNQC